MNINRTQIDELNGLITITIAQSDIKETVEKTLKDYRNKANIPGFRKGMAPMSFIKKQYEQAVKFEEINKILQKELPKYIQEEKLDILAQPIPVVKETVDLDAEELKFDFEFGLAPSFDLSLSDFKLPYYNIEVTEDDVEKTLERIKKQFGTAENQEAITSDSVVKVKAVEMAEDNYPKENGIDKSTTIVVENLKTDAFLGKKVGEEVVVNAQSLFNDVHELQHSFGLSHDDAHHFDGALRFTIEEINHQIPAELNQELFDKVYGEGKINSEEELKTKIKEETADFYNKESKLHFTNTVTDSLMEKANFELPKSFLLKYFKSNTEQPISDEQLEQEYVNSEKSIKYQLIEKKIILDNELKVDFASLMEHTKANIKNQFAMYGIPEISDEELQKYAYESLKDEKSYNRAYGEFVQQKLVELYNEKVQKEEQNITYDAFIEMLKAAHEKTVTA